MARINVMLRLVNVDNASLRYYIRAYDNISQATPYIDGSSVLPVKYKGTICYIGLVPQDKAEESEYSTPLKVKKDGKMYVVQARTINRLGNSEEISELRLFGDLEKAYDSDEFFEEIGAYAFNGCNTLAEANFPACDIVGQSAFGKCLNLTTASFPNCSTLGVNAFAGCNNLTSVYLPKCTTISNYAFNACTNLSTISLPECNSIGAYAFSNCSKLQSIYLLGDKVCSLTTTAFNNTPMSKSSYLGNSYGSIYVPAVLFEDYKKAPSWSVYSSRIVPYDIDVLLKRYSISYLDGEEPVSVSDVAFSNNTSIAAVSGNVSSVNNNAFLSCINLSIVDLPNCYNISYRGFGGCSALISVSFPSCKNIGEAAFLGCQNIKSVYFPMCKSVGQGAFSGCSNLKVAEFPVCVNMSSNAFKDCYNLEIADFPMCRAVGIAAFSNCYSLTAFIAPECSYINAAAFARCTNLQSIKFDKCTTIDQTAFLSCRSLTSVEFPKCSSIGTSAFQSCANLTTVKFPACTFISGSAFADCPKLVSLYFLTSSVPLLSSYNAFFRMGPSFSIYVKASLLSDFKTAKNWSDWSSYIVGI